MAVDIAVAVIVADIVVEVIEAAAVAIVVDEEVDAHLPSLTRELQTQLPTSDLHIPSLHVSDSLKPFLRDPSSRCQGEGGGGRSPESSQLSELRPGRA